MRCKTQHTSPDPPHHLDHLGVIALGVDRVRDLRTGMPKRELGRLKAERFASSVAPFAQVTSKATESHRCQIVTTAVRKAGEAIRTPDIHVGKVRAPIGSAANARAYEHTAERLYRRLYRFAGFDAR